MRGRLAPSVAGEHGQAAGRRQLSMQPQPEYVGVCLVAHVCLRCRAWAWRAWVARRSFWTLGRVALCAVDAYRERTAKAATLGCRCRKRAGQRLKTEEMTASPVLKHASVMDIPSCNKSVTSGEECLSWFDRDGVSLGRGRGPRGDDECGA